MNTGCKGIALLDIQNYGCPNGIEIGFRDDELVMDFMPYGIKESIENVVDYWCSSKAITDGTSYLIRWVSPNTIRVSANFWAGSFNGRLMHRKALTTGDGSFSIGLAKLFYEGYKPKTRRGKGVRASASIPLYIKCLYLYDTIAEMQLQTVKNKFNLIISDMIETVKSM